MKTTPTYDFPLPWAAPGLVTGLLLLSAMAVADELPATGQTTCYDSHGVIIRCAGTGQDGEIRAGAPLRYTTNRNGTIRDHNTGLVWEKKSDDGGIHDVHESFTWDEALDYVATLNTICADSEKVTCSSFVECVAAGVGGTCGFAGKRDWRLPNVKELQSIVNYEVFNPSVSQAFHNDSCVAGATVTDGSCTRAGFHWSSTSTAGFPPNAWAVDFGDGFVSSGVKSDTEPAVRAVRGLLVERLYLEQVVHGRYHKYTLGADLRDGAQRTLKLVVRANARREKTPVLLELRETLEEAQGAAAPGLGCQGVWQFQLLCALAITQVGGHRQAKRGWAQEPRSGSGPESAGHAPRASYADPRSFGLVD